MAAVVDVTAAAVGGAVPGDEAEVSDCAADAVNENVGAANADPGTDDASAEELGGGCSEMPVAADAEAGARDRVSDADAATGGTMAVPGASPPPLASFSPACATAAVEAAVKSTTRTAAATEDVEDDGEAAAVSPTAATGGEGDDGTGKAAEVATAAAAGTLPG